MYKKIPLLVMTSFMLLTGCGKKTSFSHDMYFQVKNIAQKEEIINYFKEKLTRLNFNDKNSSVLSSGEDIIRVSLNVPNKEVLSIITTCLISNSPLAMSNAHDTHIHPIVSEDKQAYFSLENEYPVVNIPSRLEDETFARIINELNTDIDNDDIHYRSGYRDNDDEEGEPVNYYSLYLWHRYVASECRYENLTWNDPDTTRHLIAQIPFSSENRPGDTLKIVMNLDYNQDGYASEDEKRLAEINARGIVELINEKENDYQIDPVGKPER